jgi:hypothetical protein
MTFRESSKREHCNNEANKPRRLTKQVEMVGFGRMGANMARRLMNGGHAEDWNQRFRIQRIFFSAEQRCRGSGRWREFEPRRHRRF